MSPEIQDYLLQYLHLLVDPIIGKADITISKENDQWRICIHTASREEIVGASGEVIKSIQHILRVLIHNKFPNDRTHFLLDVDNFRRQREQIISSKIPEIAQNKVLRDGKTIILVNLSGYERMLVHQMLADITGLQTTSVGPDENRKLLIMPTSDVGAGGMENAVILDIKELLKQYQ